MESNSKFQNPRTFSPVEPRIWHWNLEFSSRNSGIQVPQTRNLKSTDPRLSWITMADFAENVTAVMLVDKNKRVSLH